METSMEPEKQQQAQPSSSHNQQMAGSSAASAPVPLEQEVQEGSAQSRAESDRALIIGLLEHATRQSEQMESLKNEVRASVALSRAGLRNELSLIQI